MIEITDLQRYYHMGNVEVRALDGVTLDIEKGEFVGIMGASGSGKTTLLHLLGLLDYPTSGRIVIDGTDLSTLTDYERTMFRLYKLGYIFQDYALVPDLTVMENVSLPAMLRKDRTDEQVKKDSHSLLEKIGLCDRRDHLPRELSGGQQQRVSIARAMVNKPDILFADEPCANLDTENSRMVLDLIHQINEEMQQTIVMVSHEDWHKEYFHRIIRLKDGKVVSDGMNEKARSS
jgi:putative ABC transport system ATP-binding protein